ncbi:MAG: 50S ribosomal protein L11 methyltransferase [candidate division Zixibacteria bacterium]|nr:50S ribosomal protein L11 methyltransferase [candidate division Zixibacteria bacterium]
MSEQGGTIKKFLEIKVTAPQLLADQVSNFLTDLGSKGVRFEPAGENLSVIGYLPEESETEVVRQSTLLYLAELKKLGFQVGECKIALKTIKEQDWAQDWKKSFEPIFVTDHIVVIPSWEQTQFPGKTVIRIKPGTAFGTGDHATTQLCIRALQRFVQLGDRIVDVGCGSGILCIAAVKFGASYALGLDIDQDAVENARENLALNGVEGSVEIRQATLSRGLSRKRFHLAVANLDRREIIESFDRIQMLLKSRGVLIFSGILKQEEKNMRDFFTKKHLRQIEATSQEQWICFAAKK